MTEIVNVQIRFSLPTEMGEFNDALYVPYVEYITLSVDQIAALKQERVDAWVAAVKVASASTETIE